MFIFLAGTVLFSATPAFSQWYWNGRSHSTSSSQSAGVTLSSLSYSSLLGTLNSSAALSGTASLSGYVYVDVNPNGGYMSTSDWAIQEAKVALSLAGSKEPIITVLTGRDGSFTFSSLAAGTYTITLVTRSNQPGADTIGKVYDKNGKLVSTATGSAGNNSYKNIVLKNGDVGKDYNFAELVYPVSVMSKRLLTNTNPGIIHTVPEPTSLVLLCIAALAVGGFAWRRRKS